ncbi:MAG: metal ABC transporter permease [Phycisphaerae bacterium]|nr:metal ABC transporter permease [Phycisphaerae bacterium]
MDLLFWLPVMCAGVLSGASSAMLGVYVVGMRIPFLAVCVSHAALAGAVFGSLFGLSGQMMLLPALAAAIATALLLGLMEGRGVQMDANIVIGVLFSLSMGLAFLGIGLFGVLGRSDNEVRSLLWGSLNFCRWKDVYLMVATTAVLGLFIWLFRKELRAIMFSRLHAVAAGIPVGLIWTGFLILTSASLTVNFQTVGGLMIYSLITNPAVAAFQLAKGHDRVLLLAIALGGLVSLCGFLLAFATDLPTGATIVILSSLLVGAAAAIGHLRKRGRAAQR